MLGFSLAIMAYGGFFIPKSYGSSIDLSGGPEGALYVFIVFYLTCIAIIWWYSRRDAEIPMLRAGLRIEDGGMSRRLIIHYPRAPIHTPRFRARMKGASHESLS